MESTVSVYNRTRLKTFLERILFVFNQRDAWRVKQDKDEEE